MRRWKSQAAIFVGILLLSAASLWAARGADKAKPPKPPDTKKIEVTETLHGVTITDPYRWLEDQDSPETRKWIDEQNSFTHSIIDHYPGRDELRKTATALMKVDSMSAPAHRGDRYFYSRRRADQNLSVLYVREQGKDTVLLDPNPMTPDGNISASFSGISEDGKLIAYGLQKGGADEEQIILFDVNTRKQLADPFPAARYGGFQFTPDNKGVYYAKYTQKVGSRVYYHAIGSDPSTDKELFGSKYGPAEFVGFRLAPDGSYLLYVVSHGSAAEQVELYFQDLKKGGPITTIVNDIRAQFSPDLAGDKLFIQTNWEAPNGRVLMVDLNNPARDNWKTVIPEGEFPIQGARAIGGKLVVSYVQNVVPHIKIYEPDGKFVREVKLPDIGSANLNGRWQDDEAFYSFNSFSTPNSIYRYSIATAKQELWAKVNVQAPVDQIETKQVWYTSKDGTKVPMFVVAKKGTVLDGARPTLLTGYGGFRLSSMPGFSSRAATWILNGGVWALANLRGGNEFGEKWHRSGMLDQKQHTFDDFIAAGEWLIANKYTNPQKLAITGRSNGGLLMGAAFTQRPDLFRAVICGYPLLDMLRYQNFSIARFWVPEYGSSENAEQFQWLKAYSPYHNVKPGTKYPAIMFVTGDSDTRVAPLHARKMTALMQAANASDYPILLHYDTRAGHSGGGAVSREIDDVVDEYSFLLNQLGAIPDAARK